MVNVIFSNTEENICHANMDSQIDILNADFSATKSDLNQTPSLFSSAKGDMNVYFTMAEVNHKTSCKSSWGILDAMKSSKRGGIDATDSTHYLNTWVYEIGGVRETFVQ